MTDNPLFNPVTLGALPLRHRIVMAPMTRIRADRTTLAPTRDNAAYYGQRASKGGLIITEAVHISPEGTPIWTIYQNVRDDGGQVSGIWTDTQRDGWRDVVDAVHAKKGLIVCQLLHAGRIAQPEIADHPVVSDSNLPLPSVSASAIALPQGDEDSHYGWDQPNTPPRALATAEMRRICDDYAHAARMATDAGFDAVELHAAHGYLIDQFLNKSTNQRDDIYGGSLKNRCQLLFEVTAALIDVMGAGRVGV
ncbi:MAG: alkene reductase, partial [Candidatus Puniceispirillum sp.]